MGILKQSTSYTAMFYLVSSTDHISAKTGASPTVNISKAGAAFGAAAGAVTEVANGWYKVALTTVDTNTLGDLAYDITAAGADATDMKDQVFATTFADLAPPANFSSLSIDGSGRVDVGKTLGTAVTLDANNVINVSTKYVGGTLQTARDLGARHTALADVFLDSDMGAGTDTGSNVKRTPRQALATIRNKVDLSVSPAIVYKTDDATVSYHVTLTTNVSAQPITVTVPS